MVDDRTQRPFGSNEPAARAPAAKSPGSDPLAELARLIGQSDPFGEFGSRDTTRRASAPPAHEPPPSWADEQPSLAPPPSPAAPQAPASESFFPAPPPPNFGRQPFGNAPSAHDPDMYQVETTVPGYAQQPVPGFEQPGAYTQTPPHLGPEEDDFYEDEQPSRRRMGILVIAGVFALAVIGTAGAFGYRALFGSPSVSAPPPVIKADTAPSKIVPAAAKDSQPSKQITDRINDKGLGEKLVSREEQPVAIAPQDNAPAAMPGQGTGVVGTEPKKVRTIAIRPDQGAPDQVAPPSPPAPPPAASAPVRVIPTAKPAQQPPARTASNPAAATSDAEAEPAPRQPPSRAPAQSAQAAAPRSANAPLSLSPDAAPAPRASARAAAPEAAAASRPAPAAASGSYLVQVSSQRSEAEAQSAFASLQAKYPGQLGGKQPVIRKVDLGDKGTYYRAMVPAGSSAEATQLCSGMKAAGGSCLIQKN